MRNQTLQGCIVMKSNNKNFVMSIIFNDIKIYYCMYEI